MGVGEIYIKLVVTFPKDPKIRALVQFGADAGLARDLYVQMCLYCKEMLSDGFVPEWEIGSMVLPLDREHGNQLAKQLASVGLIKEESKDEAQGWQVVGYLKRNGTREDVERLSEIRAEAGRKGGRPPGHRPRKANGNQVAKQNKSRRNPYTETESSFPTGRIGAHARADARGASGAPKPPPLPQGTEYHPYEPGDGGACSQCDYPEPNRRHKEAS